MSKPFDDSEASRPKLPADILAFVAEVETKTKSAMLWGEAEDVVYKDVPALIAIAREQAANHERKLWRLEQIRLRDERETNDVMQRCVSAESERDALRERLAKLETAAKHVLGLLFESSACDEPCDCIDCQCIETLDALGLTE